jgi:hypothetical protein
MGVHRSFMQPLCICYRYAGRCQAAGCTIVSDGIFPPVCLTPHPAPPPATKLVAWTVGCFKSRPGSLFRAYRPPAAVCRRRRCHNLVAPDCDGRPTQRCPDRGVDHGDGASAGPRGDWRSCGRLRLPRRPAATIVAATTVARQCAGQPVRRAAGMLPRLERLSGKPLPAAPLEAQRVRDAAALPAATPCVVPGGLPAVARPAGATPLPPVRRGDRGRLLARPAARPARVPKPHRRDTCVAAEDDPPDAVRPEGVHRPDRGIVAGDTVTGRRARFRIAMPAASRP